MRKGLSIRNTESELTPTRMNLTNRNLETEFETFKANNMDKKSEEMPVQIKRRLIEDAKDYASTDTGGIVINKPDKYKAFRDGQDSAYKLAQEEIRRLKKALKWVKVTNIELLKRL